MKRRQFITLLCGAAAAWPIAARAQQATKSARVSYVRSGSAQDDPYRQSFLRGMRDNGYVEGRGITFEFHYWGDDVAATRPLMDNLVRSKVDVIVVGGTPTAWRHLASNAAFLEQISNLKAAIRKAPATKS
jgi:putative ABC transport system substrate-binding protein